MFNQSQAHLWTCQDWTIWQKIDQNPWSPHSLHSLSPGHLPCPTQPSLSPAWPLQRVRPGFKSWLCQPCTSCLSVLKTLIIILNCCIYKHVHYWVSGGIKWAFFKLTLNVMGFPCGSSVKNLPANAGDTSLIPGLGRSLGEGNGNPLSILAWEIPWTEKPEGLQSTGLHQKLDTP